MPFRPVVLVAASPLPEVQPSDRDFLALEARAGALKGREDRLGGCHEGTRTRGERKEEGVAKERGEGRRQSAGNQHPLTSSQS